MMILARRNPALKRASSGARNLLKAMELLRLRKRVLAPELRICYPAWLP
jgi:hypothetical protein